MCLDASTNQFSWNTQLTKLLLEAYSERKRKFRDPKIKKKKLWHEIVETFKKHGYTNIDQDTLDRKLRNMKRSYKTIKENNAKSSTGRGRVSWEYYDVMEEIFAEDKTINHGSTLESTITNPESLNISCQSSVECIANENHENNMMRNTNNVTSPSITPLSDISNLQNITSIQDCLSPSSSTSTDSHPPKKNTSLYKQRKKQLEIEEKRIEVITRLQESLDESNKIQQERNNLIKQLLLTQCNQQE